MALTYNWGIDAALFTNTLKVSVGDTVDSGTATLASTYCHVDMSSVTGAGTYTALAGALQTAIRAVLTTHATDYTVTYSASLGQYTIDNAGARTLTLDFTDATLGNESGFRLAEALGVTGANGFATAGSGYDATFAINGESFHSDVRPFYLIAPTIQGRSDMSDEYEAETLISEAVADDGTAYYSSPAAGVYLSDWIQMAETDSPPASAFGGDSSGSTPATSRTDGMPVFKRSVTAEVPWSYQHAWEHTRTGGSLPFLVVDDGTSESAVHELRSDGGAFRPTRFASKDFALWSVPFKTRLIGRV